MFQGALPLAALTFLLASAGAQTQSSSSSTQQPAQSAPPPSATPASTPAPDPDAVIPSAPQMEPMPAVPPGAQVLVSKPNAEPAQPDPTAATTPVDRAGLTFTAWDLELLVRPVSSALAARASVTVRNDAATPRSILPLQISSTLRWQAVTLRGARLPFEVQSLDTDLDHTGNANEALIHLPTPLAPGQFVTVEVLYEGTIPVDATRVEHLGAPRDIAQRTDWDRIAGDFTGLRGFGSVLWYPVAADPVTLGDGAKIFHVIGQWKQREAAATMRLRVRVDTSGDLEPAPVRPPRDQQPAAVVPRTTPRTAILNGVRFDLKAGALASEDARNTLIEAELPATQLGFPTPTIFLLSTDSIAAPGLLMFPRDSNAIGAQGFSTALAQVRPLVEQWLGPQKRDIALVDTPTLLDSPFETQAWWQSTKGGPVLVTPMVAQNPQESTLSMAHALAHASFLSPRPWLAEGAAQYLSSLWIGHSGNPADALGALESQRQALTLAETSDPAANPGTPLISTGDDIFLRTKSAYVLWMLREIAGEEPLAQALRAYNPAADVDPKYFEHLVEATSHKDLAWFFDDWVYNDRGLPDLKITDVISHKMDTNSDSWLVSVNVANDGYAAAEVPITVHTAGDRTETQRLRVPARGFVTARAIVHSVPTSVTVNDGATPEINATLHDHKM
jgi:hypothetical protein